MDQQNKDVFAPVNANNDQYDEDKIVEDGKNVIESPEEDAMAAIKGHIEKQDLEGR